MTRATTPQLYARFVSGTGLGITNAYDGFGRLTATSNDMSGTAKTLTYQWDPDNNRTRITHSDSVYFTYDYDGLDRPTAIKENGGTTIAAFAYDTLGNRASLDKSGVITAYSHDSVGRLSGQTFDLPSTGGDLSIGLAYNPASQIVSRTRSNDVYAFTGYTNVSRAYATNGLNQYTSAGPASFAYDANGNLISDGSSTFTYDVENRLISATGAATSDLIYDPLGRLFQAYTQGRTQQFVWDGDRMVAAYNLSTGSIGQRYVHGPDVDEPLIWYPTSNLGTRRNLQADHQGSILSSANSAAGTFTPKTYDEYGIPDGANVGLFGYTGQMWLDAIGMYYYKARMYSPTLGRFMQTDPIGYKDQNNLYAYVQNDPVNGADPSASKKLPPPTRSSLQVAVAATLRLRHRYPHGFSTVRRHYRHPASPRSTGPDLARLPLGTTFAVGQAFFAIPMRTKLPTINPMILKNWERKAKKVRQRGKSRTVQSVSPIEINMAAQNGSDGPQCETGNETLEGNLFGLMEVYDDD